MLVVQAAEDSWIHNSVSLAVLVIDAETDEQYTIRLGDPTTPTRRPTLPLDIMSSEHGLSSFNAMCRKWQKRALKGRRREKSVSVVIGES